MEFKNAVAQDEVQDESHTSLYTFIGIGIGLLIIALVAVGVVEANRTSSTAGDVSAAAIMALSPDVSVKPPEENTFSELAAYEQRALTAGTEIRTTGTGRAVLLYPNGTRTTLTDNARATVEEISDDGDRSRIAMQAGRMLGRVGELLTGDDAYEVEVGGYVTSVRGTEFEIVAEQGRTRIVTMASEVAVQALQSAPGTSTAERVTNVAAGEEAVLPRLGDGNAQAGTSTAIGTRALSANELRERIAAYAETDALMASDDAQAALRELGAGLPEAGSGPGSGTYVLEQLTEELGNLFTGSPEGRAQRALALAQERLAEAKDAAGQGDADSVQQALEAYETAVSRVARSSENVADAELRERVADATRTHTEILEQLEEQVPEQAQGIVSNAAEQSQAGHMTALAALAEVDGERAISEAKQSMGARLRSVQTNASDNRSLDTFLALRDFDSISRDSRAFSNENAEQAAAYSEALAGALRTISATEEITESLSPGVAQSAREVRQRTAQNQLSALATVAAENPEAAARAFQEAGDYLLRRAQQQAELGDADDANEAVETYSEYAQFGEEISGLAQGIRTGTSTPVDIVRAATSNHQRVLADVAQRVPEEAQQSIERALGQAERIQRGAIASTTPEEVRQRGQDRAPKGELQAPEGLPVDGRGQPDTSGGDRQPDSPQQDRQPDTPQPGAQDRQLDNPQQDRQPDNPQQNVQDRQPDATDRRPDTSGQDGQDAQPEEPDQTQPGGGAPDTTGGSGNSNPGNAGNAGSSGN